MPPLNALIQTALPLAVTPAERWASARPADTGGFNFQLLYVLVLSLLAAVGVTIVAVLIRRWAVGRRKLQEEFHEHCERAGLGEEEINLLTFATTLGRLRAPVNIVVIEAVFHRCMHLLIGCPKVSAMSHSDKDRILSVINSAQLKLGFDEDSSPGGERRIPEGAVVTLTGPGLLEPAQATIISSQGWELKAQAMAQQESIPAGVKLRAKFHRSGAIWEFETSLIYAEGRDLTLAHPEQVRFVNRRRFRRVRVRRPVMVASFPFLTNKTLEEPTFFPGRLMELGATGLVLEVEDLPSLPKKAKILVILDLRPNRGFNATGLILRMETITSRVSRLVVELTDLSEADVSELVSETNLAGQQPQLHPDGATSPAAPQPVWRQ